MKDIFEPSDFFDKTMHKDHEKKKFDTLADWQRSYAAKKANDRLKEWLAREGQIVYICYKELKTIHFVEPTDATHKAILVCIEPIEKECNHVWLTPSKNRTACKMCGADGRVEVE